MRKVIAIGESVLDTLFVDNQPAKSFVGGRIPCAAASLGAMGIPTRFVSECTTDAVGDIVVDFLQRHGVDITSVDRYPDGATPLSAIFRQDDGSQKIINYGVYPKTRFDVVWPRIDENDVVLFGSLYAIDLPQRERLFELVKHAVERKAILVYLPGFQHGINFRLTKVMPNLLENLELSDIVIAHQHDVEEIFPNETRDEAFVNHFEFYCRNYLHINRDLSVTHCALKQTTTPCPADNLLGWQAGFVAGVIQELFRRDIDKDSLAQAGNDIWKPLIDNGLKNAALAAKSPENCIS